MQTKIIFFDVDGTLQSLRTHKVLDSSRLAIKKLQEKGIKCVVCTGRHMNTLKTMDVKDIEFDAYITLNGQLVLDKDMHYLWGLPFQKDIQDKIIEVFDKNLLPITLIDEDELYMNHYDDNVYHTYEVIGMTKDQLPPIHQYSGKSIYQAMTYINPFINDTKYLDILPKDVKCVSWYNGCVDIITQNEGKVEGIKQLLKHYNIDQKDTMAFGDADNDIEMLEYVGYAIAMGNANDKVKEIADYITDDELNDGIYKALEKLELI